jgi:hypothetical protein
MLHAFREVSPSADSEKEGMIEEEGGEEIEGNEGCSKGEEWSEEERERTESTADHLDPGLL